MLINSYSQGYPQFTHRQTEILQIGYNSIHKRHTNMTKILQKANKNVKKLQKYDKTYINDYL